MPQNSAPDRVNQALDEVRQAGRQYRNATSSQARSATRGVLRRAVVAAVQAGAKQATVARVSGLSKAQVSRVARGGTSGSSPLPPAAYLVSTLPAEEVISRYRAGESAVRIGQAYGCSGTTIIGILKRNRVSRRPGSSIELPVSNEELARRYRNERVQIQQMAAEFGVKPNLISRRLAAAGVVVPVGHRRMELPDAEIVRRHRAGESINALARSYGVSFSAIDKRLRENGARKPSASWSPRTTAAQRDAALALYRSGLSDAAAAKQVGISRTTVRKVVEEAGAKRPTPQAAAAAHLRSPVMQEIMRRCRAGEEVRSLALEYGIPRSTLARRMACAENDSGAGA